MKHLVVITFYFVCIIMGCTAHNDIYSYVKEQVETSGNQISFNKFSEENGFEWDTLYFFSAKAAFPWKAPPMIIFISFSSHFVDCRNYRKYQHNPYFT